MKEVTIELNQIKDWDSFHDVFAKAFGFPDFYGRNMNAWIDCMSDLSSSESVGMTEFKIELDENLVLKFTDVETFQTQHPEIFSSLLSCISFVNKRWEPSISRRLLILLA